MWIWDSNPTRFLRSAVRSLSSVTAGWDRTALQRRLPLGGGSWAWSPEAGALLAGPVVGGGDGFVVPLG